MPVSSVSIIVGLADGDKQIAGYVRKMLTTEGRGNSSWHDSPSILSLELSVSDGTITKNSRPIYEGRKVTVTYSTVKIWEGNILTFDVKDADYGNIVNVKLRCVSLDYRLNSGEDWANTNLVAIELVGNSVSLSGVSSDPQAVAVSDDQLVVFDGTAGNAKAFVRATLARDSSGDFAISGVNRSPRGAVFDDLDTFWVADNGIGRLDAYVIARGRTRGNRLANIAVATYRQGIQNYVSRLNSNILQGAFTYKGKAAYVGRFHRQDGFGATDWRFIFAHGAVAITPFFGLTERYAQSICVLDSNNRNFKGTWVRDISGTTYIEVWDKTDQKMYRYDPTLNTAASKTNRAFSVSSGNNITYMACDGAKYWGLVPTDSKIYCFTLADARDASSDITLHSANANPRSIAVEGDNILVTDSSDAKVYVYQKANGNRLTNAEFDYTANDDRQGMGFIGDKLIMCYRETQSVPSPAVVTAFEYVRDSAAATEDTTRQITGLKIDSTYRISGVTILDGFFYVCYSNSNKLACWKVSDRTRQSGKDITATGIAGFTGISAYDGYLYALDSAGKVHCFSPVSLSEIDNRILDFGNSNRNGMAFSGNRLYTITASAVETYSVSVTDQLLRPNESLEARLNATLELALGTDQLTQTPSTRQLLAKNVGGRIREAFDRLEYSSPGRMVGTYLYPYGKWRNNADLTGEVATHGLLDNQVPLKIEDSMLLKPISDVQVSATLINQVTVTTYNGAQVTIKDSVDAALTGIRSYNLKLDVDAAVASDIANWLIRIRSKPFTVLEVVLDPLFESDATAKRIMGALSHTMIYLAADGYDSPYLVLSRKIDIRTVGGLVAYVTLRLVSPRLFGIGFELDSPASTIQDKLGASAILLPSTI